MLNKQFGVAGKAVIVKDDKVLVIYKTAKEAVNDPDPSRRRDQPGGRVEFGEDPNKALMREVEEESGLTVEVVGPSDVWYYVNGNFELVGVDYACMWKSGEVCLSEEHSSYEWLKINDIRARGWDDLLRYEKALRLVMLRQEGKL